MCVSKFAWLNLALPLGKVDQLHPLQLFYQLSFDFLFFINSKIRPGVPINTSGRFLTCQSGVKHLPRRLTFEPLIEVA